VTAELKEIDGALDTLLAMERAEQAVAAPPAPAPAPQPAGSGAMPVVEATPPPAPVNEGPAPPAPTAVPPTPAKPKRELTQLTDEELLERIDHLDRAIDRARTVLIRRYAEVERDLARLAPPKPAVDGKVPTKPARPQPRRKPAPATMSPGQVKDLQSALNAFMDKHLEGVGPLVVDGIKGRATVKAIRQAKHFLGYKGTDAKSPKVDEQFLDRLKHPRSVKYANAAMLSRGARRRRKQRKLAKLNAVPRPGVAQFDGKSVAAWIVPYLVWARQNGWKGTLNSGWRDPAYSEQLCRNMCGAPSCPGRCAGRTSNHAGSVKPAGAIDVSDYVTFGRLMARCPYTPRLQNQLGARDPVHFSASGH
jgi:hypothetical protein